MWLLSISNIIFATYILQFFSSYTDTRWKREVIDIRYTHLSMKAFLFVSLKIEGNVRCTISKYLLLYPFTAAQAYRFIPV